ncbi:MAG: hypothetical protein WC054_10190 [Candidatus Nanopelagicales bacterium]
MTLTTVAVAVTVVALIVGLTAFKAWAMDRHHTRMARRRRQVVVDSPGANVTVTVVIPAQRGTFDAHVDDALRLGNSHRVAA